MPPLSTFTPSEIPAIILLMSIAAPIGALSMIICHWLAVRSTWTMVLFCISLCSLSLVLTASTAGIAASTYDLATPQQRLVQLFVLCWPTAFFYFQWRQKVVHFLWCYGIVFFACVLSLYLGSLLVWHSSEIQSLISPTVVIRGMFTISAVVVWKQFIFYSSLQLAPIITVAFAWMVFALKRRPGFDVQLSGQES